MATLTQMNEQLEPTFFVIFGGAGHLTWRKLVPALFDLSQDRSLAARFALIAVDRLPPDNDALRRRLHNGVNSRGIAPAVTTRNVARLAALPADGRQATAPGDFPDYAARTWRPGSTQGLRAPGHRWPRPTESLKPGTRKKRRNS